MPMLFSLIPLVGWLAAWGWSLQITGKVLRGEQDLPEMDLANDLVQGAKAALVVFLYNLPAFAVSGLASLLAVLGIFSTERTAGPMVALVLGILILITLAVLCAIAAGPMIFAALGRMMARDGALLPALQVGGVVALVRKAPSAYFLVLVGQFLCFWITLFGAVACVLGVIVMANYTLTIMAHLYGQAYLVAGKKE